jgi:bacteriocin-like protein
MTPTNTFDLELTEAELNQVVGGDTALQHEAVHATQPSGLGQKEYLKITMSGAWVSS